MWCYAGQSVAFFKDEEAGISLQYTTVTTDDLNNKWNSWFRTNIHSDFIECIKKLGRLPPTKTEELVKDLKALKDKDQLVEEKDKAIGDQAQALEEKDKAIEDQAQVIKDKDVEI